MLDPPPPVSAPPVESLKGAPVQPQQSHKPGPDLNLSPSDLERLLAFIRKNMGPKLKSLLEAEDILQDTLLAAHESPGAYAPRTDDQEGGGVLQWLHTIAMHRIWNLSRSMRPRTRPRAHTSLPPSLVQFRGEDLENVAPPSRQAGPLRDLMGPELQGQTLRAIRELDDDRRVSLILRGLIETGWPTITFLTGRKRESARKLHQRCTQSLRERFLP